MTNTCFKIFLNFTFNVFVTGEVSEEIERPYRPDKGFMTWDYQDFSQIDHRYYYIFFYLKIINLSINIKK